MKKIVLCCVTLMIMLPISVASHRGNTDAFGGHYNHTTGDYHYHHGYGPHYHTNGECPYDFHNDEKPSYSSPDSDENQDEPRLKLKDTETKQDTIRVAELFDEKSEAAKKESSNKTADSQSKGFGYYCCLIFCVLFGGFVLLEIVFALCVALYTGLIEKHLPSQKLKQYEEKLEELKISYEELGKYNRQLGELKNKAVAPDGCELGNDNLPKEKNVSGWGKAFTVYKSESGGKIHKKRGCCNAFIKANVHNTRGTKGLCKKCCNNYALPDTKWVDFHIQSKKVETNILTEQNENEKLRKEAVELSNSCNTPVSRALLSLNKNTKQRLEEANLTCEIFTL